MKNFIEGLQNLLPWLAGLQLAPKIVVSIIILLSAMFFLLLIWSPTTETKETRAVVPLSVNRKDEANVDMKLGKPEIISTLTVKEIVSYINNSAPFQRDDIAKNYTGLKVNWEGALWDVEKDIFSSNNVRVQLRPEPDSIYGIYFNVPIENYPQFKIAQRGDLIGISGRIIKCSGPGVYVELEADNIVFHNKKR